MIYNSMSNLKNVILVLLFIIGLIILLILSIILIVNLFLFSFNTFIEIGPPIFIVIALGLTLGLIGYIRKKESQK